MLRISFKIWMLANLLVFALFALSLFPHGFALGWEALQLSVLFSAPAVVIIYAVLQFLQVVRTTVLFSWILFLLTTGFASFLSYHLFFRWPVTEENDFALTLAIALISGYAAVVIYSSSLHYLFQKIQYGHDND